MKIKVRLEAELDIDIRVTDSILDQVVRYYNGDFEEWAKNNYNVDTSFQACVMPIIPDDKSEIVKVD
jgi:hypothetical protein